MSREGRIVSGAGFGIALMLLGVFLFAVNDVMGKWLVATYSVGQLLFLRSIGALLVLAPIMRRQKIPLALPKRPGLHAARAVFGTLEGAAFYWAVTYMPLADVMSFYLAGPIYVAVLAYFLLGERLEAPQAAAVAIGFLGVLAVLRPSPASLSLPAMIALFGSIAYAMLMIVTRQLREAHDATLVFGQFFGALIFGALLSPFGWVTPGALELGALFLLGIVSMAGHACVNRSLKLAPASVVAPYQYTLIVWAIVLGYLAFGDVVEFWTLFGAGVICAAGLALIFFERSRVRRGRAEKDIEKPILPET